MQDVLRRDPMEEGAASSQHPALGLWEVGSARTTWVFGNFGG